MNPPNCLIQGIFLMYFYYIFLCEFRRNYTYFHSIFYILCTKLTQFCQYLGILRTNFRIFSKRRPKILVKTAQITHNFIICSHLWTIIKHTVKIFMETTMNFRQRTRWLRLTSYLASDVSIVLLFFALLRFQINPSLRYHCE